MEGTVHDSNDDSCIGNMIIHCLEEEFGGRTEDWPFRDLLIVGADQEGSVNENEYTRLRVPYGSEISWKGETIHPRWVSRSKVNVYMRNAQYKKEERRLVDFFKWASTLPEVDRKKVRPIKEFSKYEGFEYN